MAGHGQNMRGHQDGKSAMETSFEGREGGKVAKPNSCSRFTHSRPFFFFQNAPLLLCKERARKKVQSNNEIRSHIDMHQRTGVTGIILTHHYFEKLLLSSDTCTQNRLSITKTVFSKKI